jgi:hypothetical protein
MIDTGELLALAQIAIAFAGFSALVTVLGSRAAGNDVRIDAFRLRGLVEIALMVGAFSLFPIIPHKLSFADETVWRISSIVFLLVRTAGMYFAVRKLRTIAHLGTSLDYKVGRWTIWPLLLLSYAALLTVASGLFPSANSALYFATLYMDLVQSGILFALVVSSVMTIESK